MSSSGMGPEGGKPTGPDDGDLERTEHVSLPEAAEPGAARPSFEKPKVDQPGAAAAEGKPDELGKAAKPPKKQRSRLARYSRRAAFGLLGFIGFAILAFGVAYLLTPVPSADSEATAQGPEYYYDDGKTLIVKRGINRERVDLETIPKHVRDAVIAAENRSFYQDPGVSVKGTARAFWSTVSGEQLQGGSTITQQMVRNYYQGLGQERTVTRKLKEIMVSLKVGNEKDKDWILEQYLNTIYFGREAYGIQAAAKSYYNKDVGKITPAEAAYLAAAIQQPTPFGDPVGQHRPYVQQRWQDVVNAMVQTGALSQPDAAALKFPKPLKPKATDVLKGQIGYMVNIANKELRERRGYTEDDINRGGLKITTTFNKKLMEAAEKSVKSNMPGSTGKKTRTALVSVDPATGQVVAFYGGRNFLSEELSSSFGELPQVGSGFKPIVLAAALNSGKKLYDTVDGSGPMVVNGHPIKNSHSGSYGDVNLVTATEDSINTAYVRLGEEIGLDKVTTMAEKMGIPRSQLTANGANTAATFPLGVASVRPVQQAGVYATFATEGVQRTPYVVKAVTDADGDKKKFGEKGKRVFSQQVARDATYAMKKVVQSGTGTGAQLYDGRDVAGKTGTTDNGNALWFNGFIPQLSTSVAIFRADSPTKEVQIGDYSAFGGILPAQIWREYTGDAVDIKGLPSKEFGEPSTYTNDSDDYPDRPTDRPTDPSSPRPSGSGTPRPPSPNPSGSGKPTKPGKPTRPGKPTKPQSPRPGGGGDQDGRDPNEAGPLVQRTARPY